MLIDYCEISEGVVWKINQGLIGSFTKAIKNGSWEEEKKRRRDEREQCEQGLLLPILPPNPGRKHRRHRHPPPRPRHLPRPPLLLRRPLYLSFSFTLSAAFALFCCLIHLNFSFLLCSRWSAWWSEARWWPLLHALRRTPLALHRWGEPSKGVILAPGSSWFLSFLFFIFNLIFLFDF